MTLEKSSGITKTEQLLARLCHKTFLGFWSYPNVYREPGHELVDLLVVSGQDIILFSDKRCAFPLGESLNTNWSRWFKRAILKSAQQLFGAERWIKEQTRRLYLDAACQVPLPLKVEQPERCRFHRIVVASGAKDACRNHVDGSGSLVLATRIKGNEHCDPFTPLFQPFFVGHVLPEKGWVHVLDDVSLPLILEELDTITDFLSYLTAKESLLLTEGLETVVAGEENLLGTYLANEGADFRRMAEELSKKQQTLLIADGIWDDFCAKGRRDRRRFLGSDSRQIWDKLIIQEFASHAFQGTLFPGSPISVAENEELLRILATESRVARAFLTHAMMERCLFSPLDRVAFRVVSSPTQLDTIYAFVFLPCKKRDDRRHRAMRQSILGQYLWATASRRRQFSRVVGIATELGDFPYRTFDLMVLEIDSWNAEMEATAKQCISDLNPFNENPENLKRASHRVSSEPGKVRRNDLCPCGSGKKFKRCCLKYASDPEGT